MSMRIESEADLQQIVDGVAEGRWWVRRGSGVGKYNGGYTGLVCVRTGKFIARMDLSLIERLWDILDPESPAERRKRTMTGNVDDLREGIRAGLSEDMKTEADNMDDMADRIESERPGGINVGAGGNGIAGIGRRLVVGGRPVCEKERFQIDGMREDAESLRKLAEMIDGGETLVSVVVQARRRRDAIGEERDRVWAKFIQLDLAVRDESLESFQVTVMIDRHVQARVVPDRIAEVAKYIKLADATPSKEKAEREKGPKRRAA